MCLRRENINQYLTQCTIRARKHELCNTRSRKSKVEKHRSMQLLASATAIKERYYG